MSFEIPETLNIFDIFSTLMYFALALIALWGAFCVVMVWMRVGAKRFRSEQQQDAFLDELDNRLSKKDFDGAMEMCQGDRRAMPQLVLMALENREIGLVKTKKLVVDRFQRDILADLEYRLSWVNTVIKTAPMVGLLGTVLGMMGAFSQLATADNVEASAMAGNIQVALYTTACGLAIAIPLVFCTAAINVRMRKMEDLVSFGLTRFFDMFKKAYVK